MLFLEQFIRGIAGVLFSFEHEQYPSNSVNPWCLITKYPNDDIVFLGGFGRGMQYPPHMSNDMLWNPIYLWDTLRGGITCSLNVSCHK
jgi:hypothetical protein